MCQEREWGVMKCLVSVFAAILLSFVSIFSVCPVYGKPPTKDPMGSPPGARGKLYALVVGVGLYKDGALPKLDLADQDAKAFGDFLKTQDRLFHEAQITSLINDKATKAEIEKYLYYTLPKAGKDDTVILFLSGHGRFDPMRPKEFFFLPHDAENEFIATTGVRMSGLEFLNGISAEKILIIADACYAGGFSQMKAKSPVPSLELFLKEAKHSSGRAIISSSKDGQLSWELPGHNNSVFTHNLLEGLRGKADRDHDGLVTLNEAYEYAYAQTKDATKGRQHPQFEGSVVGMFPLSVVGSRPSDRELRARFLKLVADGDKDGTDALLSLGVDVDYRDQENITPLMVAASVGHVEIVRLLLAKGADPNATDNSRTGPLSRAASQGHIEIVRSLLDTGSRQDQKDSQGWTALAHASHNGHASVSEALMASGADPKTRTDTGDTPLGMAASKGHVKTIEVLLDWGTEVNTVDLTGVSPLMKACRSGNAKAAELLLDRGAELKLRWGTQPQLDLLTASVRGDVPRIKKLLELGIFVDSETDTGETPFMLAACLGHVDAIKILAQRKANINVKGPDNRTPFMMASSQGNMPMVSALMKLGVDIHVRDGLGNSALMLAVINGRADVVKLLINASVDVTSVNSIGMTPLLYAVENNYMEPVRMLLAKGAKVTEKDKNGNTALMIASQRGNSEAVKLLLAKGSNVNEKDLEGNTALTKAVHQGDKTLVRMLIAAGADVHARDWEGKTALAKAEENNRSDLVELLRTR
ncbi:MAG: ankyrin repeat protein 50 [Thermodesulfobacteriota bacterium]|nr:ankyrin repeat protein 50 [Thermodesulfobacteriota bacterium]